MSLIDLINSNCATINIRDAASVMGLDPRTVSKAISEGSIPSIKVCGRYLIPVAALCAYLGVVWQGGSN